MLLTARRSAYGPWSAIAPDHDLKRAVATIRCLQSVRNAAQWERNIDVDNVRDAWDSVLDFFDRFPLVEAAAIVVVALLLARVVDWLVTGSLRRLVKRSKTEFDDRLADIIHRPIKTTVLMVGLIIATQRLGLSDALENTTTLIVITLLFIVWMAFGHRLSRLILATMKAHPERFTLVQESTEPLLANTAAVIMVVIAAYAVLVAWDINITGLVASAGIIGLALSFAAQDTLGNLFAGVAILSDRPYKIGDFIILDTGERGKVTRIGLRSTRLLTRDDVEVSIPNGVMGGSKIVNEAGGPAARYRIRTGVDVAFGSDIDIVVEILKAIAARHNKTLTHPAPRVRFREFAESGLRFELLCWIAQPADRGLVLHELNSEIYREFAAANIKIPYPQRDLNIKQISASDTSPGTDTNTDVS